MSRAGAIATRELTRLASIASTVAAEGVRKAAMTAWEADEEDRIETAKRRMERLLQRLGLPTAEPFVLDDFALYDPHERVCVALDGIRLNYVAASEGDPEMLMVIAGRCTECGERPLVFAVSSLADLARVDLPSTKRKASLFKCSYCRRS